MGTYINSLTSFINENNKFDAIEKFIHDNISDQKKLFVSFSDHPNIKRDFNSNYNHISPKGFYAYPLYNPDSDLNFLDKFDVNRTFKYFTDRRYVHFMKLNTLDDIFIQNGVPDYKLMEYEDKVADILIKQYKQNSRTVYADYASNDTVDGKYENGEYNTTVFYEKIYLFIMGYLESNNTVAEDVSNMIPNIFEQLGYKGILTYTDRCIDRLTPNQLVLFDMSKIISTVTL